MHNTFDFADPSARGGRRGRQLSLRVIKRAKKEKRRREEREKKEVGHERMVIKRIAVISLPVALTFASVDEFNRYHFAWKRASERASEQAASAAGGNGNTYAPLLNACKSLTIQSKRGRDRSFQPPVYTCLALMREARIPFSFLHNKRISYRAVTRDFSRERERESFRGGQSRATRELETRERADRWKSSRRKDNRFQGWNDRKKERLDGRLTNLGGNLRAVTRVVYTRIHG